MWAGIAGERDSVSRPGETTVRLSIAGIIAAFVFATLAAPLAIGAQPLVKIPRIGLLHPGSSTAAAQNVAAFRQGLRELGHVGGQNIAIEYRYAEGRPDRLPGLAAELVGLKVDVMVPSGIRAIRAAKQASDTIPIIVPFTSDLVGTGLVAGLARPGGNITGLTAMSPEIS